MKLGSLCNRIVTVAEPHESVRGVAALMRDRHVGCVVIVRGEVGERVPVGLVTDRDIAIEVVARGLNPEETPVAAVMSSEPYCARDDHEGSDVLEQMRTRGLRRVPVVDSAGTLQGVFTFDDFVQWTAEQLSALSQVVDRAVVRERRAVHGDEEGSAT